MNISYKREMRHNYLILEAAGTEEIFCDSDSRFQMLERVCKGRMLPMLLLFFWS